MIAMTSMVPFSDTYAKPLDVEYKHYPIEKIAFAGRDSDATMTPSLLWRMQQRVFDAKREIMRLMHEKGYVPVDDDFDTEIFVEVTCYVKRRAVDGEATDGQWIKLPVDMQHLTAAHYKGFTDTYNIE